MTQWDKIAKTYDEMMGETGNFPHQRLFNPAILQFLGNFYGKVILDAGCGNGYWARFLASKAKRVVGIDASKELLRIAKLKDNYPNLIFKLADLNKQLPFRSESFDVIISNMVLHSVQNIKTPAKEFYRLLRKRGRLIFSIAHPKYESKKNRNLRGVRERKKFYTKTLGGRAIMVEYYQSLGGYKKVFKEVGFKLIGLKEPLITEGVAKEYPRYKKFVGLPRAAIFCWQK